MKRILLSLTVTIMGLSAHATIPLHLGLCEFGFNFGKLNKTYSTSPGYVIGYDAGIKYKSYLFDVGVLLWSNYYRHNLSITDEHNLQVLLPIEGNVHNTSITLTAGKTYNINNVHLVVKGILAPTFLHKHEVELPTYFGTSKAFNPNTEGFYFGGGYEVRVGYFIKEFMVVDLKYTYLSYFSGLSYSKSDAKNIMAYQAPINERPLLHGLGVQLNFYFEAHNKIWLFNRKRRKVE